MRRLLIDTDPGVHDSLMLQLALKAPEVHLEAITTTFGNCGVEATTRNALLNLDAWGRADIPVARGPAGHWSEIPSNATGRGLMARTLWEMLNSPSPGNNRSPRRRPR